MPQNTLIVIVGPTGVGKTSTSLHIAEHFGCDVLSADSRQVYRNMSIGTAAPTKEELQRANHHFVQFLNPDASYNASRYETGVLETLDGLFQKNNVQLMVGGSMMYIDAVCKGIDIMPDADMEIREALKKQQQAEGLEGIRLQLKKLDPESYNRIDLKNPARLIHALEMCLTTGKPYSSFLNKPKKQRPFQIIKIGLNVERPLLYERINNRVLKMMELGLVDEVKSLLKYRNCNALQTVGYKEVFAYLDGEYSLDRAVFLIQRNSRHYAKKQLTWFRKDKDTSWYEPAEYPEILNYIKNKLDC